ncbi:MAG: PAS domain-containing protein [Bacteroidetes bacterium]|nr:PAS domain-containing protein [Bacteroidota bacterium]
MKMALDLDVINSSEDCIAAYDKDLRVLVWNNALATKYNIPPDKAIGTGLLELFPHIKDDFRVKCLKDAIAERKTFFFPNLPYHYEEMIYTQLITTVDEPSLGLCVISIVKDHKEGEIFKRSQLLSSAGLK